MVLEHCNAAKRAWRVISCDRARWISLNFHLIAFPVLAHLTISEVDTAGLASNFDMLVLSWKTAWL